MLSAKTSQSENTWTGASGGKAHWCQNMPTALAASEFDLVRNEVLAETIRGYIPKR